MSEDEENNSSSNNHHGGHHREKTTQWLEDVLETYYTFIKRKNSKLGMKEAAEQIPLVVIKVNDFDIGPGFSDGFGRLSTLSDLLSLKVWFQVEGDDEGDKTENLIVKIPPNDINDREMAHLAQVDKREIHFYTEALVQLEEWAESRNVKLKLSVPKCYFAKYHAQQPPPPAPSEGRAFNNTDATLAATNLTEAESVLVLEDIRPLGFTMKDFSCGLTLEEAMAALREIAIVHALSWSMQELTGEPLDHKWEFAYRPRKAATAYKMMIEQGFPTLAEFLEKQQPDGAELLQKLKTLHPKAVELLCELLEPPAPPLPSCLTHMDFWCNNLLFRKRMMPAAEDGLDHSSGNAGHDDADEVECQIVDWQMMAISRPTHDIALLLFTSLTPEVRQENSDKLLKHYWTVFQSTAKKVGAEISFGFDTLENEYKKSQLLALLLVIGSIDLALDFEATELRLMQALRDMAGQDLI